MTWKEILDKIVENLHEESRNKVGDEYQQLVSKLIRVYFDKDFPWTVPGTDKTEIRSALFLMMDKNPVIGSFAPEVDEPTEKMYEELVMELLKRGVFSVINETTKALEQIIERSKSEN